MHTRLSRPTRDALLQAALLTPLAVGLERPEETALALRTADLFSFRRPGLPLTVRPFGYQGKEGAWVIAVVFHLESATRRAFEGVAYLNPRKADDLHLLHLLTKQEQLPVIFFSSQLRVAVSHRAEWTVHHRQDLRLTLAQIGHARIGEAHGRETDPDFERVKGEFERLYSAPRLLKTHGAGEIRLSSSFKGAVLD
jgi:hypothetical protein